MQASLRQILSEKKKDLQILVAENTALRARILELELKLLKKNAIN